MPSSPVPNHRARLLTSVAEILVNIDGEPADLIAVWVLGIVRGRKTRLKFETEAGEVSALLGWGARLSDDEAAILRALGNATEPLMARGIARAIGVDEESSTLREWLAPEAVLRRGGYVKHTRGEGYALSERGRQTLESLATE